MNVSEALEFFGLTPPRLRRGMTQSEVDVMVSEWRESVLDGAVRDAQKRHHPDHGGDEKLFKKIPAAREALERLRLRVRKTDCAKCGSVVGEDAFCGNCGARARMPDDCTTCGRQRNGERFCPGCGTYYGTSLDSRLVSLGWSRSELEVLWLKADKLEELNRFALVPEFDELTSVIREAIRREIRLSEHRSMLDSAMKHYSSNSKK